MIDFICFRLFWAWMQPVTLSTHGGALSAMQKCYRTLMGPIRELWMPGDGRETLGGLRRSGKKKCQYPGGDTWVPIALGVEYALYTCFCIPHLCSHAILQIWSFPTGAFLLISTKLPRSQRNRSESRGRCISDRFAAYENGGVDICR